MITLYAVFLYGWVLVSGYSDMQGCLDAASALQREQDIQFVSATCTNHTTNETVEIRP